MRNYLKQRIIFIDERGQLKQSSKSDVLHKVHRLLMRADLVPYLGSRSVVLQMKVSNLGWKVLDLADEELKDSIENDYTPY